MSRKQRRLVAYSIHSPPQHNKRFDIIIQQFISNPSDPDLSAKVAHYIDLLYAILENIVPKFEYPEQGVEEPLIASIFEHITKLINLLDAYAISNVIIVDRTMKFFVVFSKNTTYSHNQSFRRSQNLWLKVIQQVV